MHAKGWTRDRALAFMRDNTALSEHEITTEIDRYISPAAVVPMCRWLSSRRLASWSGTCSRLSAEKLAFNCRMTSGASTGPSRGSGV
jgi:hypothetical protein